MWSWTLLTPAFARPLPETNRVGDFWADQAVAAERFVLTPHTWSVLFAVAAVLLTAWAVRRVRDQRLPEPELVDPIQHRRWLLGLLIAFVLFYAPGFLGDFNVYDDPMNIWDDPVVSEFNSKNLATVLFHNHRGVNQEWMFLSLQLCYAAFGRNYAGFFALNLLMLPVLLFLVHQLAWLLTRNRAAGLLTMAFFGMSPIVAELVCWMLERGHYFGLIFALTSCVAYLRYLDVRDVPTRERWAWLTGSLVAYAASQLGKPVFLYVPLWLVLFDVLRRRSDLRRAVAEKLPYLAVAGVFLTRILSAGRARVRHEYVGGSVSNTLALDANQVLEYFRSCFLPTQTGIRTPWNAPASWLHVTGVPDILVHGFSPLASLVILLCLLTAAVVLAVRARWPWLLLAGVGGVISLGPVANFPVHTVVQAYRYAHSTNVLVSIVLAMAVLQLAAPGSPLGKARRWLPLVAATVWLTIGAYHTQANRNAWSSSAKLWTRSAYVLYPHDGWSAYYAAKSLQIEHRHREAIPLLVRSLEQIPGNQEALRRLGHAYHALGETDRAAVFWRRFFAPRPERITPRYARLLREVGLQELVPDKRNLEDW